MFYSTIQIGNIVYLGIGKTMTDAQEMANWLAMSNTENYMDVVEAPSKTENHPRFSKAWKRD